MLSWTLLPFYHLEPITFYLPWKNCLPVALSEIIEFFLLSNFPLISNYIQLLAEKCPQIYTFSLSYQCSKKEEWKDGLQNWYFVTKIVLTYCEKTMAIKKNFWNLRLKAENLQTFCNHKNNIFKQWKVTTVFVIEWFFNLLLDVSHIE